MQVISEYPNASAGEMAQRLGVSNGAISQTLARLEKKGMIHKHKDTSLKNRVTAAFTASGKEAMERFEAEQASSKELFSNYLKGLSKTERKAIESFLSHIEEFVQRLE
jgi:DNA-binding MarR family transcriptional regulator